MDEQRLAGTPLLDLTSANPTEVFDNYPHTEIRQAYARLDDFAYQPDPFGSERARHAIADWYRQYGIHVSPEQLALTASTSEAYALLFKLLCNPGDEVLLPAPSYPLFEYLARLESVEIIPYRLLYDGSWFVDFASMRAAISEQTRAIVVVNPNNPTGSFLTEAEVDAIVQLVSANGAWLIADEIYRGAELSGKTPSFWGRYEKLLVTSSLSKVYRLAGLRIGWIAGPEAMINELWRYHDYTTTTTSALSAELAVLALEPERCARIVARTLEIGAERLRLFESWADKHRDWFSYVPTRVAGHAFFGYRFDIPSAELARRLIDEAEVLLAPGAFFGKEHHFRIGYGVPNLEDGLDRLTAAFTAVAA